MFFVWNWIVKNAKKSIFTILWALNFEFLWIGTNFWYEFFPKPKLKASKLSHQQFLRHDWFHIKSEQKKKKNEFPHWLKMRNSHQAKKFQFQLNIASLKNILESKFLKYLLCICLTHSHCRKWEIFFHQKYISWKQLFFTNFFSIKTFSRIYLQKMSKRKFPYFPHCEPVDIVETWQFSCHSNLTWNQFWLISEGQNQPF